jgi:hypothetical protein
MNGGKGMGGKHQSFNRSGWAKSAARVKVDLRQLKRRPQVCGLPRAICGPVLAALGITSALIALTISQAARAQVVEVITRPGGQDTVNWGQLNLAPGTTFPTPQNFTSFGLIDGEATVDKNGVAVIQEQCCPNGIWDGNFSPGDILFDTSNTALTLRG